MHDRESGVTVSDFPYTEDEREASKEKDLPVQLECPCATAEVFAVVDGTKAPVPDAKP